MTAPSLPQLREPRKLAEAVESRHRRGDWLEEGWHSNSIDGRECNGCREDWPCSAERLRAALPGLLDRIEHLERALTQAHEYMEDAFRCLRTDPESAATALWFAKEDLAKLLGEP